MLEFLKNLPGDPFLPFPTFTLVKGGEMLRAVRVPVIRHAHNYIEHFGGVQFASIQMAENAAFEFSFPTDSVALTSDPRGRFIRIYDLDLFVPARVTIPVSRSLINLS